MAKIGDTVRFLNSTGGGIITKIEGKLVYVNENGFETPALLKDVVVVLPTGHEPPLKGAKLMFDQAAFDKGKHSEKVSESTPEKKNDSNGSEELTESVIETDYGDNLNITMAFEPSDVKALDRSKFTVVIINDSNYFLDFTFLRREKSERGWSMVYKGTIPPNESIDAAVLTHEDLPMYDKIAIQALAYKQDKIFSLQPAVSVVRKLDLTKFHKFHCFRPGTYFDNAVIEVPLVKNGFSETPMEFNAGELERAMNENQKNRELIDELSKKYNTQKTQAGHKNKISETEHPNKLLPVQEIDLHIGELVDTTAGMEPKDMLDLQLSTVRKQMNLHSRRKGQKIVFIHGKGEGVLRKAVLDLLKKEYPKAEIQDASFREYGFGATLVTIH